MTRVLDTVHRAASAPLLKELPLSDFNPALNDKLHIRVNPTVGRWKQLQSETDPDAFRTLIGELIVDPETGQGLTPDETRQLFGVKDDEDGYFLAWLVDRITQLIKDHQEQNFTKPKPQ